MKQDVSEQILRYVNDGIDLTESNFLLFSAKHYDNSQCSDMDEFMKDLSIPMHLKKLFTRYHAKGDLKEQLIINHIISFFNVFEPIAACKILFFNMDEKYYPYLKTALKVLHRDPEYLLINGKILNVKMIEIDKELLERLQNL